MKKQISEESLQSEIILRFRAEYRKFEKLLIEINNNSNNVLSSIKHKKLGRVKGCSDLILLHPTLSVFCSIEVKVIGSRHDVEHLKSQIEFAESIENYGGFPFFLYSYEGLKEILNVNSINDLKIISIGNLNEIKQKVINCKTKTLKI